MAVMLADEYPEMGAVPFGHQWTLATHVEDVSPEEMERRARERAERVG